VVGVGVGDVDGGELPTGCHDPACKFDDVVLHVLGVEEDRFGGAEDERGGGR
jgi:hypothetical protein